MPRYLIRNLQAEAGNAMEWTLVTTEWGDFGDDRVRVATYIAYPPHKGPRPTTDWTLEIYRQFRFHLEFRFTERDLIMSFIAKRIRAASGGQFEVSPSDLTRTDKW